MKQKILAIAVVAVTGLLPFLLACTSKEQKRQETIERIRKITSSKLDTMVLFDNMVKGKYERALFLSDSLEETGDFSMQHADYYRGVCYELMGETDKAIGFYRRAVANDRPAERDIWFYQTSGNRLAEILFGQSDFEGALRVATPVLAMMDSLEFGSLDSQIKLRSMMGLCNMELNQPEKAKENFARSYEHSMWYLGRDTTLRKIDLIFGTQDGIVSKYLNAKYFDEALMWVNRMDSLAMLAADRFGSEYPEKIDFYNGCVAVFKSIALQGLGRDTLAANAYSQFLATGYAHTDYGRINAADYLMAIGRYAEASDNYAVLDLVLDPTASELSLDEISQLLIPKLRANYFAGRKDSALYVARQIAQMFDSAFTRQKNSHVAELATIYDTQGKEMQIARQQAELSKQRLWGTVIALVLLSLFFAIYTWNRRRAQKRLAIAHEKLETAHEKLETAHTELKNAYDQLEETTAAKERIESELRIARDIQMSMVPGVFPEYEGLDMFASMTPAKEVGGDLYGYVMQDNRLYFCLGDVSGKGVPASLFMAQSARLFRTLATEGMMPANIAYRMNNELAENNDRGMFVTMFIGLLHLDTGSLDFCNCGHNPPVVDGQFLEMQFDNQPLGLWEDDPFEGESIDDIRGRQMLIYTDGLNEAEDPQQQLLGNDRLIELMSTAQSLDSHKVIDMLKEAVAEHRAGAEPNDDLTLMCLRLDLPK